MNLKNRLIHLAQKLDEDRQTGKTTMLAKAAKETNGILLAHDFDYAKKLERQFGIVAKSVELNLEGFFGPFFIDNHANAKMFHSAANKIEKLEMRLQKAEGLLERVALDPDSSTIKEINKFLKEKP